MSQIIEVNCDFTCPFSYYGDSEITCMLNGKECLMQIDNPDYYVGKDCELKNQGEITIRWLNIKDWQDKKMKDLHPESCKKDYIWRL